MLSYINGQFLPFEECKLHVSDLGFQRGYGIFDFFRAKGNHIIWKEDYFDRLFNSIDASDITIDLNTEKLEALCLDLQAQNNLDYSTFKVMVTGGLSSDLGTHQNKPSLIIIQNPFKGLEQSSYENGVNLISLEYQRPDPEIKTLNYYFSIRQHRKIKEFEALDVLFYTDQIRETGRSNFFGIKNGIIHTPKDKILKGITRKHVLELSKQGFSFQERDIFKDELFTFEEVFITGTTKFIVPVVKIDGKQIGKGIPGELTRKLIADFRLQIAD